MHLKEARAMPDRTVSIHDLRAWKGEQRRWVMLTAYDFPTAQILDRAGVPVLLVGDSLGRNVLGYENELPVTMEEMLHHVKAVARGAERAMVVGDLPFMSYQASIDDGVRNAGRFVKEGGAHAVKLEGPQLDLVHRLTEIGIPVMAHVGLDTAVGVRPGRLPGTGPRRGRAEGPGSGRAAREGRRVRDRARGDARRARPVRSRRHCRSRRSASGPGRGPTRRCS